MNMSWIDTNTLIAICACAIGLTQFLFWRYIARNKSYESEKGKLLATKKDIKDITQKVEEVKNMYSTSLERYKFELQTEFETSRYVRDLCHSLDRELIKLISDALKVYSSQGVRAPGDRDDSKLISSTYKISEFLYAYRTRYRSNKKLKALGECAGRVYLNAQLNFIGDQDKADLILHLHSASEIFLPEFETKPA
jgi:hypothetical protein